MCSIERGCRETEIEREGEGERRWRWEGWWWARSQPDDRGEPYFALRGDIERGGGRERWEGWCLDEKSARQTQPEETHVFD